MGLILRKDPCGIGCCILAWAMVGYADYVVLWWLLGPWMESGFWGFLHALVFNLLLLNIVLSHLRAMLSDPGIVPFPKTALDFSEMEVGGHGGRSGRGGRGGRGGGGEEGGDGGSDSEEDVGVRSSFVGEDWTVCGRCEAYRPPRAHHCRVCKRCVRKMDHHCPWINNCVGELNQKYFLLFLAYVGLSGLYVLLLVGLSFLLPPQTPIDEDTKHEKLLHTIFVTVEATLFLLFVAAVGCDQVQAILGDETAVESVQRRGRHRPAKSRQALFREVCGPGPPLLWLLPCHSLPASRDLVHIPSHYPV